MTIAGVDCGSRTVPALDTPRRTTAYGISAARVVTMIDYGAKIQDVPIVFALMAETTKNSLKAALMDTVKPGGVASVTPDSGDDMGIGASGATNLIFIEMKAEWVFSDKWKVELSFKRVA